MTGAHVDALRRVAALTGELLDGATKFAHGAGILGLGCDPEVHAELVDARRVLENEDRRAKAAEFAAASHAKTAERSMHRRNEAHHRNTED